MSGNPAVSPFPVPDPQTLHAIRAGDRHAADVVIRACEPKLRELAGGYAVPGCDRDMLVEAGRRSIWSALRRYDPERGPFDNYVTRAVINGFLSEIKANPASPQTTNRRDALAPRGTADPSHDVEAKWHSRRVRRALRSLLEKEFDVLFLIYGCGCTERRAASVMGISQPRVNQLRNRAVERLAEAWTARNN